MSYNDLTLLGRWLYKVIDLDVGPDSNFAVEYDEMNQSIDVSGWIYVRD